MPPTVQTSQVPAPVHQVTGHTPYPSLPRPSVEPWPLPLPPPSHHASRAGAVAAVRQLGNVGHPPNRLLTQPAVPHQLGSPGPAVGVSNPCSARRQTHPTRSLGAAPPPCHSSSQLLLSRQTLREWTLRNLLSSQKKRVEQVCCNNGSQFKKNNWWPQPFPQMVGPRGQTRLLILRQLQIQLQT